LVFQQQENKSHGYGSASGAAAGKPKGILGKSQPFGWLCYCCLWPLVFLLLLQSREN
jgi:hypothetical protein